MASIVHSANCEEVGEFISKCLEVAGREKGGMRRKDGNIFEFH